MLTHEEFKNKYLGQFIRIDVWQGQPQCTSVPKAYIDEVDGKKWRPTGGYPLADGGVSNAFYNYPNSLIYPEDYVLIENDANDPNCQPIQGDKILWGEASGLTGVEGHVAVCDSANSLNFNSIDQNWNAGKGLQTQIVNHSYRGVLGWLRLKQPVTPPEPQPNPEFKTVYPNDGDGLWLLCHNNGYPVISTDQPNCEPTNSICYNRIAQLNGTYDVTFGKAYKVDFDPIKWFNSVKPKPVDSIIIPPSVETTVPTQPQPEAITTPAQPTMPTYPKPEPKAEITPDLDTTIYVKGLEEKVKNLSNSNVDLQKRLLPEANKIIDWSVVQSNWILNAVNVLKNLAGGSTTALVGFGLTQAQAQQYQSFGLALLSLAGTVILTYIDGVLKVKAQINK